MGNSIPASSVPPAVIVPTYVADGYSGSGTTRTLTFSGGAPPTDGSIAFAFVVIQSSLGFGYVGGAYQRLLYWADTAVGIARVGGASGIDFVSVPSWSFVADANVSD
jgi:hypothetical protein